jgi:hypothetical protein
MHRMSALFAWPRTLGWDFKISWACISLLRYPFGWDMLETWDRGQTAVSDIFISYAREDAAMAKAVAQVLQSEGCRTRSHAA